jgi:hypothetical protein
MPRRGVVAAVIATVLVVAPILRQPPRDSFPLSTYPMFATDRGPVAAVNTVLAVDGDGVSHTLSPELIGGSDEVILAAATVSRAIRGGTTAGLCNAVAERAAGSDRAAEEGWRVLEVVTHRYDTVSYLAGDEEPESEVVHATCTVEGAT